MLTGIGGGMVRDMLAAQVPAVLRGDVYAVAALAGAAVVVVGRLVHLPSTGGHDRRSDSLLRDPLRGDPPELAAARRWSEPRARL